MCMYNHSRREGKSKPGPTRQKVVPEFSGCFLFSFMVWKTICRGAHNLYSDILRGVPADGGWYTPHTSDLMKLTQFHKGDSIFYTQILKCFLLHFLFLNQTVAA